MFDRPDSLDTVDLPSLKPLEMDETTASKMAMENRVELKSAELDLMSKRVELDRWYISNWSLWLDIVILFRTLILGLQPTAY